MHTESKLELGLHYIIEGHNAKIALVYSNEHLGGADNDDRRCSSARDANFSTKLSCIWSSSTMG